jgi:hypothetical protein
METTILELTNRLEKLEDEMRLMRRENGRGRHLPVQPRGPLTAADWGAIATEDAERNAEYYSQLLAQALTEIGIFGESISRDELFKRYEQAGFNPEANEFAQGIVAMREEELNCATVLF